jgi:diguanylate cyclase (GGDEF)-like protein
VLGPPEKQEATDRLRMIMKIPFGHGVTGAVFRNGQPMTVPDVRQFPSYISHGEQILSEVAVPLKRGDNVVGVLDVERVEADGFSSDDVSLLTLFASQAAIAIENARLFGEQQSRVYELATIQNIVQKLTPLHDIPSIAAMINEELKALIDYHSCRLFVLDQSKQELLPISLADFDPKGLRLKLGEGITGSIALHGRSEIVHNMQDDPRGWHIPGTPYRPESMIGTPLIYEGRVRGVITLTKLGVGQFDENALRLLEIIAAQAAIAFDRARLYEELRTEAVTDELTKLYNRRYLLDRYREEQSRAIRNRHTLAAIMLDIDRFKTVNDRYGHDAGDVVLRKLAGLIRAVVRAEDIVARYGGEEFCVLLPEIPLPDAEQVAERLRLTIREHLLPEEAGVSRITVSVGMAFLLPDEEGTELFTRADQAMFAVKRRGGNRVCLATASGFVFYDHDDMGRVSGL